MCPGRDRRDADDLAEGGRAFQVQRRITERIFVPQERDHGTYGKPGREDQGRSDHDFVGQAGGTDAQQRDKPHRADGEQRLAEPDLIAENRVVETEAERVPKEEARKQRDRRDVRPEDRQVGQQDEPERQEAQVLPAGLLFEGVDAARAGRLADHVLQVPGDHQDHAHAQQQAEHGPQQAGLLQVGVTGDDKRTPADARADRKRPHPERGDVIMAP